jgi:hypothetical protein
MTDVEFTSVMLTYLRVIGTHGKEFPGFLRGADGIDLMSSSLSGDGALCSRSEPDETFGTANEAPRWRAASVVRGREQGTPAGETVEETTTLAVHRLKARCAVTGRPSIAVPQPVTRRRVRS